MDYSRATSSHNADGGKRNVIRSRHLFVVDQQLAITPTASTGTPTCRFNDFATTTFEFDSVGRYMGRLLNIALPFPHLLHQASSVEARREGYLVIQQL